METYTQESMMRNLMMGLLFDPGAKYVYKAEKDVFYPGQTLEDAMAHPVRFATSADATAWARKVQTDPRIAALWPVFAASSPLNVTIGHLPYGAGARTSVGEGEQIEISDNGFGNSEDTLLHEIAHVIVSREYHADTGDYQTDEGHGPLFTGIYLRLLKEIMGDAVANKMYRQLKKDGATIKEIA